MADAILRRLVRTACDALEQDRGAVYLPDERRPGRFTGCVAHPGGELEAEVRRMSIGGPADALTRELVETRRPVVVADARRDPRAATGLLRAWRVTSILGVPLLCGENVVGLLFLDGPRGCSPAQVRVACSLAGMAAGALAEAQAAARLRGRFDTVARQNRLLRHATAADHRLAQVVVRGGGLPALVAAVAELTGKPVAVYDAHRHRVASACAPDDADGLEIRLLEGAGGRPEIATALDGAAPGGCLAVGPLLAAGARHRHLVAPVDLDGERWGWVAVMERRSRFSAYDEFTTRRAATYVALELCAQRRAVAAEWDARSALTRQLLRGTSHLADLRRSADYLGVALDAARVCAFVTTREGQVDGAGLVDAIERRLGGEVLATKGPEGVALLLDLHEDEAPLVAVARLKAMLASVCDEAGGDLIAGLSAVCRDPSGLPRAYREAREVARCIDAFARAAGHRVLATDDLGPGRLFIANGEVAAIERFVEDVIGALIDGDDGCAELLRTLQTFYDAGRSIRVSATWLGIHENTVRYRLARVRALTGLDIASDASDQLSAQMALLVLRLQGHPALPSFDGGGETGALAGVSGG